MSCVAPISISAARAICLALDQGFEIALGAEAWAADYLARDKRESKTDHFGEVWAKQLPPLPLDNGGTIQGRIEDLQGRYNLNNLIAADGSPDPDEVKTLEALLGLLRMDTKWAAMIADWLDSDTQPGFPEGAEDSEYTSQTPPHLAANMAITRVSELMVMPGFGLENYRLLAPNVTALPRTTTSLRRSTSARHQAPCSMRCAAKRAGVQHQSGRPGQAPCRPVLPDEDRTT
jgi:general secretion pathway protein K